MVLRVSLYIGVWDVAGFDDRAREWSEVELHGGMIGESTS